MKLPAQSEFFRFFDVRGRTVGAGSARDLRAAAESAGLPLREGRIVFVSDGPGHNALTNVMAAFKPAETGVRWFYHQPQRSNSAATEGGSPRDAKGELKSRPDSPTQDADGTSHAI